VTERKVRLFPEDLASKPESKSDPIALIDLDSTVADYDKALREVMRSLEAPNEPAYADRYTNGAEPAYIEARRKLVQRQPGFWRNLEKIPLGFEVVDELRRAGFKLHVLTKGPQKNGAAWGEKLEWSREHLPDATVTVTGDKSIVYGRVLVDDFPPYFLAWLANRPRGLVISVAHPWNEGFKKDGAQAHPNVLRYDGTDVIELREALRRARDRESGAPLHMAGPPKAGRCEACDGSGRTERTDILPAGVTCPICRGTGTVQPGMQFRVMG
jgi:5'(3')-deoxyribonucleotidase